MSDRKPWQAEAAKKFRIHGLSPRKAAFCLAYLSDPKRNVAEASRKAGYSGPRYNLLRDPDVAEAIRRQLDRMTERYEITVDSIVQELAKLGFANLGNYLRKGPDGKILNEFDLTQCTPEQLAALEAVQFEDTVVSSSTSGDGDDASTTQIIKRRIKINLHDKKGALTDLLRQLGGQFEKDKPASGEPQKIIVEGGLPDGDTMPEDIKAAAEARKAKRKARKP